MSNLFSSWWIHLYPRFFREQYEEEMLLLFREQMRDEVGFSGKLRIQFNLLRDLVTTLPQVYSEVLSQSGRAKIVEGDVQTFRLLDDRGPGLWIYTTSTVITLLIFQSIKRMYPCPGSAHLGFSTLMWLQIKGHQLINFFIR